ncbi:MAG: YkgJ family cysteine cluster protein [Spirochaetales bacterium]|jgi:Fe-S-cluster containining protein|nr:YkgJ family cysteine cluster protein [Spirochaetales bacterium]
MKEAYYKLLAEAVSKKQQVRQTVRKLKKMRPSETATLFFDLHSLAFEEVDCLECANCCISVGPLVNNQDIVKIGKALGIKRREVISQYLKEDDDGDMVFSSLPCPFLRSDKKCLIYDARPKACREYPHTDQRYIHRYLGQTEKNSRCCPAVAFIFQKIDM